MNITDINDKIIQRSNEQKKNFPEFAWFWGNSFLKDMQALNVMYPNYITRVSEYIPEIISFIEVIIKKGYAYEKNGSVYFDIEAYKKGNKSFNILIEPFLELLLPLVLLLIMLFNSSFISFFFLPYFFF